MIGPREKSKTMKSSEVIMKNLGERHLLLKKEKLNWKESKLFNQATRPVSVKPRKSLSKIKSLKPKNAILLGAKKRILSSNAFSDEI